MKDIKVMIDSGAHSLYHKNVHKGKHDYSFYSTKEFWNYVDEYVDFIKANKHLIEVYVSVDIIYNPELTWKVQKYLEKKGLKPLPVFHPGEDMKWLKKYVDNYEYIGMGGLGQTSAKGRWLINIGDPAWNIICDERGKPRTKVHGFAMTSPELILRYPYYSVDSSSWMQFGKYGLIIVPKKKNNKFVFEETPHIILVSARLEQKQKADHFDNLPEMVQEYVREYVESKGTRMGKSSLEEKKFDRSKTEFPISKKEFTGNDTIIEEGVCNSGHARDIINLHYYLDLEASIPKWPRIWKRERTIAKFPI